MYKHILIAVDDSPTSDRALQEAIHLAKDQQAKLHIVYVVNEVILYREAQFVDQSEIEKAWIQAGHQILGKALSTAVSSGVDAEIKLLETEYIGEQIADVIAAEATRWPANIVVAGTHGRSGLKHLVMGSVAEGIVRMCPVPILLVRDMPDSTSPSSTS